MVKVFLEESAETFIERLREWVQKYPNACIICPTERFIKNFVKYYPDFSEKRLLTPTVFFKTVGITPITTELAALYPGFDPDDDPLNCFFKWFEKIPQAEQITEKIQLTDAGVEVFREHQNLLSTDIGDLAIVVGEYPSLLLKYLQKFFRTCMVLRRIFKSKNRPVTLPDANVHCLENLQEERLVCQCLLENHAAVITPREDMFAILNQTDYLHTYLYWLDWQEFGRFDHFLLFLREKIELQAYGDYEKQIYEAQRKCLSENFLILKQYLLEQGQFWIAPFMQLDFPGQTTLKGFLEILSQDNNRVTDVFLKPELKNCSKILTRRQFFIFLRKIINLKTHRVSEILPFNQAVYFPVKCVHFVHAVVDDARKAEQFLSWLKEVESRGGEIYLYYPAVNEKGIKENPLLAANEPQKALLQPCPNVKSSAARLILPACALKFSCKGWERYCLAPRKTWLDNVLRIKKIDAQMLNNKARICGEWVHENLQFYEQPLTLAAWKQSVKARASERWAVLKKIFQGQVPFLIQQWHDKALGISQCMVDACQDLFQTKSCLYSEYVLPMGEYRGRIDLLAVVGQHATIIDFKTANHYAFTIAQMKKGYGLQLFLYGQALRSKFDTIDLRVVDKNGNNRVLAFDKVDEEMDDIKTWLGQLKCSGCYDNIPQERPESLPIAW